MRTRDMPPLLDARSLQHPFLPRLQLRELIDVDARPAGSVDPAPMRDIRYRALAADQVLRACVLEVLVQGAVQSPCFVLIAVDPVGDLLGGVAVEMVGLALHGSDAGV